MSNYAVTLHGPAPWGFRLQGGKDFNMPLTISRISPGSKAAQATVVPGDVVLQIDGTPTDSMTHLEAQTKIKNSVGNLRLTLQRSKLQGRVATGVPHADGTRAVTPQQQVYTANTANPALLKDSLAFAHKPIAVTGPGGQATIIHAQYNTPISMYSQDSIMDAIAGQTHVRGTDVPGIAAKEPHVDTSSHVYQAVVKGDDTKGAAAHQSRSFQILAHLTGTEGQPDLDGESVKKARPHGAPAYHGSSANQAQVATASVQASKSSPLPFTSKLQPLPKAPNASAQASAALSAALSSSSSFQQSVSTSSYAYSASSAASKQTSSHALHSGPAHAPPAVGHSPRPNVVTTATIRPNQPAPGHVNSSITINLPSTEATPSGGPASRPPWVTDDQFAQKYAADRSTTTISKSVGPASGGGGQGYGAPAQHGPPAPPFAPAQRGPAAPSSTPIHAVASGPGYGQAVSPSRGKVQWAQHCQPSQRTPMCGQCNQIIRGPFLVALGKSWHPAEFNCAQCHTTLTETGFVEEQGNVYCETCYEKYFAPDCAKCRKKIMGEIMHALRQTWHTTCFVCASCGKPFGNSLFHMEDGEPYCEKDYVVLFSTKCHGCDFPVEAGDKFIEALGHTWHDTCFICAVCHVNLEGQPFYSKKDKPLCKKHAHAINV
ncbi:LIM domain-binding protein 3-like isoform X2 [Lampetra planeri]